MLQRSGGVYATKGFPGFAATLGTHVARVEHSKLQNLMRGEVELLRAFLSRRKLSVAIVGVALVGTLAAVALGSGGFGFAPTNLVTGIARFAG